MMKEFFEINTFNDINRILKDATLIKDKDVILNFSPKLFSISQDWEIDITQKVNINKILKSGVFVLKIAYHSVNCFKEFNYSAKNKICHFFLVFISRQQFFFLRVT